jgi:hypothetical protein
MLFSLARKKPDIVRRDAAMLATGPGLALAYKVLALHNAFGHDCNWPEFAAVVADAQNIVAAHVRASRGA